MPNTPHGLLPIAASLIILIAAVTDLRTRRIPNWLTLPSIPIGMLLNFALDGVSGLMASVFGVFIALLIYVPLYLLRAMGAGDGKLMAAIAAFIGWYVWLHLFFAASILGGIVAVLFTLAKGELRNALVRSVGILRSLAYFRAPFAADKTLDIRSAESISLPHGSVIALGWFGLLFFWGQFDLRLF
jgi:prepilin peptidase CpaA